MSFCFKYKPVQATHPVVSLAGKRQGQSVRPRPLIVVTVIGPTGLAQPLQAILDTAADDAVFPDDVADAIGVDLTQASSGSAVGVGGTKLTLRYCPVTLRLAGQHGQQLEWSATVAFASLKGQYPLLGYAGFLQFFDATFWGEREEVELKTNSSYPGT